MPKSLAKLALATELCAPAYPNLFEAGLLHRPHSSLAACQEVKSVDWRCLYDYHPPTLARCWRTEAAMAKVLKCRDVGVDCDFVALGATVEEVIEKAKDHACSDHGFKSIPPELADKVMAAIHDEEAATA